MSQIKAKIDDFLNTFSIKKSKTESCNFEKFCNYIVLCQCLEVVEEDVVKDYIENMGVGNAQAIDGLLILVDGNLIEDEEGVKKNFEKNTKRNIEISLIFSQAKYTDSINNGDLSNFERITKGIYTFDDKVLEELSKGATSSNNQALKNKIEILYALKPNIGRARIIEKMFYASLKGKYSNEQKEIVRGKNKHFFTINDLVKEYDRSFEDFNIKIDMDRNKILFIDSANYSGLLPYKEFKKIVFSNDGNSIRRNIFDANIRDYIGKDSDVNKKIEGTITDSIDNFYLLNNGVTIVCTHIQHNNNQLNLVGPKVVNGCQTTNSIFNQRQLSNIDKLLVPIKLISIDDIELRDKITLATNSQNKMTDFTVVSLKPFVKELEDYFNQTLEPEQFYFERLENQYRDKYTDNSKKVTIQSVAKIYLASVLNRPDSAAGYGKIKPMRKINEGEIYNDKHSVEEYYLITYLFYTIYQKLSSEEQKYHYLFLCICYNYLINNHSEKFERIKENFNPIIQIIDNMKSDYTRIFSEIKGMLTDDRDRYKKGRIDDIIKNMNCKENLPDNLKKYAVN